MSLVRGQPSPTLLILCVTFDSALNFNSHVTEICKSANFHLRALAHIRQFLTVSSANLIACSIVASRLDYCNSILTGISSYNLNRLQCVQNRAARIVLGVGRRASAAPLLRQLHWLPVLKRMQYKTALITYKTLYCHEPEYLSSLLCPYNPPRTLRSSSGNLLTVPRVTSVFQSRAFSVEAPRLWNSLPAPLRALADLSPSFSGSCSLNVPSLPASICISQSVPPHLLTFKRLLKTYLFDAPSLAG